MKYFIHSLLQLMTFSDSDQLAGQAHGFVLLMVLPTVKKKEKLNLSTDWMGGIRTPLSSTAHIIHYRDSVVILASGTTWAGKEGQTMLQYTDI